MQNFKNVICETEVLIVMYKGMDHGVTYYGMNTHLVCPLTLCWTEYLDVSRRINILCLISSFVLFSKYLWYVRYLADKRILIGLFVNSNDQLEYLCMDGRKICIWIRKK